MRLPIRPFVIFGRRGINVSRETQMTFPPIRTTRLVIRPLRPSDADALAAYRSRPEVARFQSWDTYSTQQANDLIGLMQHSAPEVKGDWYQFGVELAETGQLIGDVGVLNTDAEGKSWIGFTLDPAFWKRGLASEAVGAILKHYAALGITTIWASTDPRNQSSRTLLEKLGFAHIEESPTDWIYRCTQSPPDVSP